MDGICVVKRRGLELVDGLLETLKCGRRSNSVGDLQLDLSRTPVEDMPLLP